MNVLSQIDMSKILNIDLHILLNKSLAILGKLAIALAIFFIGKFIATKLIQIIRTLMLKSNVDDTLVSFFENLAFGLLMTVVIIASLNALGVNTTSMIAVLGGASVAIGLALQGEIANFASGVVIILFRPFNVGDYISVHGEEGTVKTISLINTSLTTLNNHQIIIPNKQITSDWLINYSSIPTRRVDIVIGVSYDTSIEMARKLMLAEAHKHSLVLSEPQSQVVVKNFGDNSVNLALLTWTENMDWLTVEFDLQEAIKNTFDQHGIEIPFPQQVVHLAHVHSNDSIQID